MQKGAQGTAFRRFGLISSSQCRHTPKEPSSIRRSAERTLRSRFDSRSRFRIASSRSAACCTSSKASALFSIVMASRLRTICSNSSCLFSRIFLNLFISVFVIFLSPSYRLALPTHKTIRSCQVFLLRRNAFKKVHPLEVHQRYHSLSSYGSRRYLLARRASREEAIALSREPQVPIQAPVAPASIPTSRRFSDLRIIPQPLSNSSTNVFFRRSPQPARPARLPARRAFANAASH